MKIAALIVTYNRLAKLKITLEKTLSERFDKVVIVNNDSTDGTGEWLASVNNDRLIIINSETNSGGAGGFKLGIDYILRSLKVDWVTFYDDDAFPESGTIEKFRQANHAQNTIWCGKVLDMQGNICDMNVPWAKIPQGFFSNIEYFFNKKAYIADIESLQDVVTFSFVGCLIHSSILSNTYNMLDEKLFLYFDDVYYSWQLTKNGCKIFYDPGLVFKHDIKKSKGFESQEWKVYYLIRNLLLSKRKLATREIFDNSFIVMRVIKYISMAFHEKRKTYYLMFLFKGIWHGLTNKTGKL